MASGTRSSSNARARVAAALGAREHVVVDFDLRTFGGSALTADIDVPKDRAPAAMAHGIPVTYVPARNTIFLSFALAYAETRDATDAFLGVNALDYSGYPDCRPEYIAAFERMANLATRAGVEGARRFVLHTPLIALTKADIVRRGLALGVDFSLTCSCYDPAPDGAPCLRCDACQLRQEGLRRSGCRRSVAGPLRHRREPAAGIRTRRGHCARVVARRLHSIAMRTARIEPQIW